MKNSKIFDAIDEHEIEAKNPIYQNRRSLELHSSLHVAVDDGVSPRHHQMKY